MTETELQGADRWHTVNLAEGVYLVECERGIVGAITRGVDFWRVSLGAGSVRSEAKDYTTCLAFIEGFEKALLSLDAKDHWERLVARDKGAD